MSATPLTRLVLLVSGLELDGVRMRANLDLDQAVIAELIEPEAQIGLSVQLSRHAAERAELLATELGSLPRPMSDPG
jgi:thiamine monophosphate synthase